MAATHEDIVHRIKQAMHSMNFNQQELALRIEMDPTALSKAFAAKRQFKPIELARIAEELNITVASLLEDAEEPALPVPLAARVQPKSDSGLDRAMTLVDKFVDIDTLLSELGHLPRSPSVHVDVNNGVSPATQGEHAASQVRNKIGIASVDLPAKMDDLAEFVENNLGIDVAFEPLDPGLDGISVSRGNFKLALVSTSISATRQRFTLGHEICHILAGDSQTLHIDHDIYGHSAPEESRANAFSAAFLMPQKGLVDAVRGATLDEGTIAELLGRYRVSLDALAFRLKNCGVIDQSELERIRRMSSARIALRGGRVQDLQARNDRRIPQLILARAVNAYVEGAISIRPIASILEMDADVLLDELSPPSLRGVKSDHEVPSL